MVGIVNLQLNNVGWFGASATNRTRVSNLRNSRNTTIPWRRLEPLKGCNWNMEANIMYSCQKCNRKFKSKMALAGHCAYCGKDVFKACSICGKKVNKFCLKNMSSPIAKINLVYFAERLQKQSFAVGIVPQATITKK